MNVRILPSAKDDLRRGYRFYERQEPGISAYFLDSMCADIDSIKLFGGIHKRRGLLFRFKSKRFPYWIHYRIETDTAFVAAVLDAGQSPAEIAKREQREQTDPLDEGSP